MPFKIDPANKTPFSQSKFLNFLRTDDSVFFKKNIVKVSNSKEPFGGFCYGASTKFLHYCDKGLEHEYINTYNDYLDNTKINHHIMQKKRCDLRMFSINRYRGYIRRQQEIKKGHYLLKEIFDIQHLHYDSVDYPYLSKPISSSSLALQEKCFITSIESALKENKKKYLDHYSKKNKEITDQLISKEITLSHEIYLSKRNQNCIQSFNSINKECINLPSLASPNYTQENVNLFLQIIQDAKGEELKKTWQEINKKQNLQPNIEMAKPPQELIALNDFFNMINTCSDLVQNYIFSSQIHSCAINIKKGKDSINYIFFDPNKGMLNFTNFERFSSFLKKHIDKNKDYRYLQDINSNYYIKINKLRRINPNLGPYHLKTKKPFYVKLKTNELLAIDKFKKVFKETNDNITHRNFDKKNYLVTLDFNYTQENKSHQKQIYSSNIDADNLHQVIQDNLILLKQTNENIFIDEKGYIYPITPNVNMAEFNINANIGAMFGSMALNHPLASL